MSVQIKTKRTKKEVPTCQICVEPFNKSSRLAVQCPYCHFELCRTCCETYILGETEVKCMSPECGKIWTRKHIRDIFTLVFINGTLREHREKILFDKEKALLPATQPIIEGRLQAEKIQLEINALRSQIHDLQRKESALYAQKNQALNRKSNTTNRAVFIRACPDADCRGFLSSQWKCGVCEKWTCPDCHIVKGYTRDTEHTCNEDDLATARLIAADTKPCPQCATGIFKIDGCDQMWCTQCHTAFSWRTGQIQRNVHNPHYFEWMRRTGGEVPRNPNDVPCGRNIDHYLYETFSRLLRSSYYNSVNMRAIIDNLNTTIRYAVHMLEVERPPVIDYERRNENLRVQYLMKEISEKYMQDLLQRDDKRHHKNQEIYEIYTLVVNTTTDILYRFLEYLTENRENPPRIIDVSILGEINQIVDYANECLADVAHTYACARHVIDNQLRILRGQRATEYIAERRAIVESVASASVAAV